MPQFRSLRAGIFLPPFHPNDEDPLLCMERDFELMQWLDMLDYSEAWIGEHHSGGYEIYGQPELFIATAAERTRHIRLGTGVISLPYHHPLMVADRIVQLDYQTRGRAMFGFGPGLLPSDAMMLGIDPEHQRVGGKKPRPGSEHDAPARVMVELDDAVRHHQRVVVGQ
ncbi:MAG: LLM class flavin-dependent oxidoreductase [Acetobacteraceae bacterium]|nr:LLM class flavin-dependent oxidoreductase [Acetobacteraceae bacterium]